MPLVIGPQWTIIGDYVAGGGLRNVIARCIRSIKSPTKRPHSEDSGAAGDSYCFLDDRPGGCHRRNCAWGNTKNPTAAVAPRAAAWEVDVPWKHGAGSGDRGGASCGGSGWSGRGIGGTSLSNGGGGGGGGGGNSGVGHSGGGPTRN